MHEKKTYKHEEQEIKIFKNYIRFENQIFDISEKPGQNAKYLSCNIVNRLVQIVKPFQYWTKAMRIEEYNLNLNINIRSIIVAPEYYSQDSFEIHLISCEVDSV